MSNRLEFWAIILVLAVGTLLQRSLPLWLHGTVRTPPLVERLLRQVPAAALTALVVPGSLYVKSNGLYEFSPPRIAAAVVALVVALRTRNMIATLAAGMIVLWAALALASLIG